MLTVSLTSFGTKSLLARTSAVRALTVVRPVVSQLLSKPCYQINAAAATEIVQLSEPKPKCKYRLSRAPRGTSAAFKRREEEVRKRQETHGMLDILFNPDLYDGLGFRKFCHQALEYFYRMLILKVDSHWATAYNAEQTTKDGSAPAIGKNAGNRNWLPFYRIILGLSEDHVIPCSVAGCTDPAVHGGHMMLQAGPEDIFARYPVIVPLCALHNTCSSTPSHVPQLLRKETHLIWLPPHLAWAIELFWPKHQHNDSSSMQHTSLFDLQSPLASGAHVIAAADRCIGRPYTVATAAVPVPAEVHTSGSYTVRESIRQQDVMEEYQRALYSQIYPGPGFVEKAGVKFVHIEELERFWSQFLPLMIRVRSDTPQEKKKKKGAGKKKQKLLFVSVAAGALQDQYY